MNAQQMSIDDMRQRIEILSDEIDANEEENRAMQEEIARLYKQIDERRKAD